MLPEKGHQLLFLGCQFLFHGANINKFLYTPNFFRSIPCFFRSYGFPDPLLLDGRTSGALPSFVQTPFEQQFTPQTLITCTNLGNPWKNRTKTGDLNMKSIRHCAQGVQMRFVPERNPSHDQTTTDLGDACTMAAVQFIGNFVFLEGCKMIDGIGMIFCNILIVYNFTELQIIQTG